MEKKIILILGSQRSWSSITMRLLEAHGVNPNIPSFLDPTGHINEISRELRTLAAINRWVYKHLFHFQEDETPYRTASRLIRQRTQDGYATLSEGEEYPAELLGYGCDLINRCTRESLATVAMKFPAMILCWDFWKQVLQQSREKLPHFIFGMTVRNPYEVALSYITRNATGFQHLSDIYGTILGCYRSQLAVIEEYRHQDGFTVLPVRACREHHQADIKRLLETAGVPFSEAVYGELFEPRATHDTGIKQHRSVFEAYEQLFEICSTL